VRSTPLRLQAMTFVWSFMALSVALQVRLKSSADDR